MDKKMDFVHLHCHTEYSLLDGASRISDIAAKAKEMNMKALAITDHGAMYGVMDFYNKCVEVGIKPIIGCEVYVAERSRFDKDNKMDQEMYHLVLLAKNEEGYKNLVKLDSLAFIEGFYYKPRIDHEILEKYSEGLIGMSACLSGEIPKRIIMGDLSKAKEIALYYYDLFKGDFYLELQNSGIEEQQSVNRALIDISADTGIPLVATNDVHYTNKEDAYAQDVLMCIQTGKTVDDENRMKFKSSELYLKSAEEMYKLFKDIPQALENTCKIADKCNLTFNFDKTYLPEFEAPDGIDNLDYLKKLCNEGLNKKYNVITDEIKERLDYELNVIDKMGYVNYFLIVWDFLRYAKENDIMTGPGRGSGAASIVAYCLDITKIDPIKYNLTFERFLNPERISPPDIDTDFEYERREDVIDYVVRKYGKDHVSQIITFGTMAARAAIRDVGRALNMPYADVDKIAKKIPFEIGMTIDKALEMNSELMDMYKGDEKVKKLIDVAKRLEGLPRHASTHAAGVVISKLPLMDIVPLQKNDDVITTQFPMKTIEAMGILKMDFLGLRTLTVIKNAIELVKKDKGTVIDIDRINYDDDNIYKMISSGDTAGVFQLESKGMTQFMTELKPGKFEDIIAGISLFRPGPMEQIPRYIANKRNPDMIKYDTPLLKNILDVTYGCMVYQEQVMQIVRDLAGYSMGRSDLVRRAMSKKKYEVMQKERHNFIYGIQDGENDVPGALKNGVDEETANKIFDEMMDFAKYAFNKAHAAAYAIVAYQTAYLKYYYPVEFMASMLTSEMDNTDKIAFYIQTLKKMGIKVLPPDINESMGYFNVANGKIRFGLYAVKNVGRELVDAIIKARGEKGKFKCLTEFLDKVDLKYMNKRAMESLIKCGSFDSLGGKRAQYLAVYEKYIDSKINSLKRNVEGQLSLFDISSDEIKDELPDIPEFDSRRLLSLEKEVLGIYISGHPLSEYESELKRLCNADSRDFTAQKIDEDEVYDKVFSDGQRVTVGGMITGINVKITRNNSMMAFVTIEDLYGSFEIITFSSVYENRKSIIVNDNIVLVTGRVSVKENENPVVICDDINTLSQSKGITKLFIKTNDKDKLGVIKKILTENKGNIPVYILSNNSRFMAERNLWVNSDSSIVDKLEDLLGKDCARFVYCKSRKNELKLNNKVL